MDWGGGVIFESGEEVQKPYGNCCLKIPGMISIYNRYCHLAIMSEKCHENGSYRQEMEYTMKGVSARTSKREKQDNIGLKVMLL